MESAIAGPALSARLPPLHLLGSSILLSHKHLQYRFILPPRSTKNSQGVLPRHRLPALVLSSPYREHPVQLVQSMLRQIAYSGHSQRRAILVGNLIVLDLRPEGIVLGFNGDVVVTLSPDDLAVGSDALALRGTHFEYKDKIL